MPPSSILAMTAAREGTDWVADGPHVALVSGVSCIGESSRITKVKGDSDVDHLEHEEEPMRRGVMDQVVATMNERGLAVDISHLSKPNQLAAARRSAAPLIARHSLATHRLHLHQGQINALRDCRGVVRLTVPLFATQQAIQRSADVADRIDRTVATLGIDHVALECEEPLGRGSKLVCQTTTAVSDALERRGYSPVQVRKLWHDNLRRVLSGIREVSRGLMWARELTASETVYTAVRSIVTTALASSLLHQRHRRLRALRRRGSIGNGTKALRVGGSGVPTSPAAPTTGWAGGA